MEFSNKLPLAIYKKRGCPKCGRDKTRTWLYNVLPRRIWQQVIDGSIERGLDVNITPEYVEEIFEKQNRKCALTGWPLIFAVDNKINTASIDRIDSFRGYIKENIQIIHKRVNICKWENTEKDFYLICKSVVKYKKDLNYRKTQLDEVSWSLNGKRKK